MKTKDKGYQPKKKDLTKMLFFMQKESNKVLNKNKDK